MRKEIWQKVNYRIGVMDILVSKVQFFNFSVCLKFTVIKYKSPVLGTRETVKKAKTPKTVRIK